MSYYAGSSYYPNAYAGSNYGIPMARSYSYDHSPMMPTRQYYPSTPMYAPSAPPMMMPHHQPTYSTYPMGGSMPYYGSSAPTVIISRSGRHHHHHRRRSSSSSSRHRGFLHYL